MISESYLLGSQANGHRRIPSKADQGPEDPTGYIADEGLKDAVTVALALAQPLLLTGQPGTGKTTLAAHLAASLELAPPLRFETKSTSTSRDLFYTYDTVGRFHAAHADGPQSRAVEFVSYAALGLAILRTRRRGEVKDLVPQEMASWEPQRSVVLIDELDKAPRDFPNDILNEIEDLYFKIPELGNAAVTADRALSPIVVITSNSEKHLPDAFLRRCIFYDIPFPRREQLQQIICNRLGTFSHGRSPLLDAALDFFLELRREANGLQKPPGTAELIGWLAAMTAVGIDPGDSLSREVGPAVATLSALLKTAHDQRVGREIFRKHTQS
jgi:MoxR-like ATPase